MNWEYFYENYLNWNEQKLNNNAKKLEDFGLEEDVAEVAMAFSNIFNASDFVIKALEKDVRFSKENILELVEVLDEKAIRKLLIKTKHIKFSKEEIFELSEYADKATLSALVIHTDALFSIDELEELEHLVNEQAYTKALERTRVAAKKLGLSIEDEQETDKETYRPKKKGLFTHALEGYAFVTVFDAILDVLFGKKK